MNARPTDTLPDDAEAGGDDGAAAPRGPSKTQRKKDMHALQDLGAALVALPEARIAALPLGERLHDEVKAFRQTRSHEGRRRQMQLIGKLMRGIDPAPIREAVAAFRLGHAHDALALHEAERWRAELLADDEAQAAWCAAHPDADRQQLRSLVRAARKDAAAAPEQRSGRAYRELFRFLRAQQAPGVPGPAGADARPDADRDD